MEMFKLIEKLRDSNPLVLHYTNEVTINDCANVTLAIGASPLMSYSYEELEDMIAISCSVVINIGTMNSSYMDLFLRAGLEANRQGKPVIFDPVGVFASGARIDFVERFLREVRCAVIKGNGAEIQFLSGLQAQGKGVDSAQTGDLSQVVRDLARRYECVVAATGERDYISDGDKVVCINNGSTRLRLITGTGCMTTSLVGSYIGACGVSVESVTMGVLSMAISGEIAQKRTQNGVGEFRVKMMDALSELDYQTFHKTADISMSFV